MIGACLGDYRIVRLLGAGGMGQVFEAVHVKLGRRVALKVLGTHRDPELLTRLEREARAAAQMHHPNIVQVTALHVPDSPSAEDPAYLVMEFVDGDTLQHRLDAVGRLDAATVRRIGVQMASALAYAHERGVIHRDVKPDNILLTEVPGVGLVAKLLDFGIARLLEETALTRAGTLVGTPRFMSPEQALGRPVGSASDVFGLGATMYVALFASPPFPGRSLTELSMQLASPIEVAPPTDVPLGDRALVGSILRCLAKNVEARPGSGAELQRELELQERDTQPLPISEQGSKRGAGKSSLSRGMSLALGIAALVVVVAGFGVSRQRAVTGVAVAAAAKSPDTTLESELPRAGAVVVDLVLGDDRPCLLLSSGEVFCWSLGQKTLVPGRVPGTGTLHVDEIDFRAQRLVLRAGREHLLFFGDALRPDPEPRRISFRHAPVSLGEDEPLSWTCPANTRGCFVWTRSGMRWTDEERGVARSLPTAAECRADAGEVGVVDVAYPVAGNPWLWLLRCGEVTYFLAHEPLRDRLPPEDRFYTRVVSGLPARSQLLGAGEGTLKVRHGDGKLFGYHPKLTGPGVDPGWQKSLPIAAGYHIPFGPTERAPVPVIAPAPCVLDASGITCDSSAVPVLAERARLLASSFGAAGAKRIWSNVEGIVCALGDSASGPLPWALRCIGSAKPPASGGDVEVPRDVLF